jgi:hypothetical protein
MEKERTYMVDSVALYDYGGQDEGRIKYRWVYIRQSGDCDISGTSLSPRFLRASEELGVTAAIELASRWL